VAKIRSSRRKGKRGGGKRHGKVHHQWLPKAGAEYGLGQCDPWIMHTVYDTRVGIPRADVASKLFARLRAKHVEVLTRFDPRAFLSEVRWFIRNVRVDSVGTIRLNTPPAKLPDEEVYLFCGCLQ